MDALGKLVEIVAIFAVIIGALALWDKAAAQKAQAQTSLMRQGGYTSLELMAGESLNNFIFGGR